MFQQPDTRHPTSALLSPMKPFCCLHMIHYHDSDVTIGWQLLDISGFIFPATWMVSRPTTDNNGMTEHRTMLSETKQLPLNHYSWTYGCVALKNFICGRLVKKLNVEQFLSVHVYKIYFHFFHSKFCLSLNLFYKKYITISFQTQNWWDGKLSNFVT